VAFKEVLLLDRTSVRLTDKNICNFFSALRHGWTEVVVFLGAFAKLQKASISFVMSVARALETTLIPLYGFARNFVFEYFSKTYGENSILIKT